eukprot:CAMPEP_0170965232 /NCGR_PEP_ID=MMETSP0735-20130129/40828_1 /TAXON_ID=186038 /ORGANISM="Fragilariopsis kerguelensis, Strain L26-C5" /LENGTH=332 /DNA_ID=CAMNT_0011382607 /DNA_START=45 /DNA_END=1040 /DNA_ORIENTATION=-
MAEDSSNWRDTLYIWDGITSSTTDGVPVDDTDASTSTSTSTGTGTGKDITPTTTTTTEHHHHHPLLSWKGTWVPITNCPDATKADVPKRNAFKEFIDSDFKFTVSGTAIPTVIATTATPTTGEGEGIKKGDNEEEEDHFFVAKLTEGEGWDMKVDNDDDDDDDDSRDDHLAAKAMCTQGIGVDSNSCDSDHDSSHERRNSRLSSLFWNNEDEDDAQLHQSVIDLEMKSIKETSKFDMPEDVYAFIITSAVWSPSFLFACYVIVIKYIVYAALLTGINIQNFEGADKTATAVKFFLIPVAIAMQNDLMEVYSGISNVKYDQSALEISKYATYW